MGQAIGTVRAQKLSESEFSYEWHFCKVNFDLAYRSPVFGFTCKEFSSCYLEMKPNIIHRVLAFYLCGCKRGSGSKISSSAVLVDGNIISYKSNEYDACLDLEPSMKIFEIHLSDPMLSSCFNFILNLRIKLHCYSTYLSSILNENASHQNIQNAAVSFSSFNEISATKKSLESNATASTTEVSTSIKYLEYKRDSPDNEPINTKHFENKKAPFATLSEESRRAPNLKYEKELVEDLGCLYTSGDMSDLEIRIGEDVLRAHKLILCARSPVFKKMVGNDCFESASNSVTITDCPVLPFKTFLKYLYTGEIEDSAIDIVMSLCSLGYKYNVRALPEACSDILQNKLSSETIDGVANIICDVLQLAECHKDSKLQDLAISFIVNHFPVVSKKQNWKDLMKSNFELTSEILALVATRLQKVKT